MYGTELSSFLHNGTWYDDATIMYFPDADKVEVVYVSSSGMVFLNTTDPKLIEEFPDAKSLDPNSKCKFRKLLIITDSNGTIIGEPFGYGKERRNSKEFRIGDLKIKKNTPLPAGEYLIGMNAEDEAGNRDIDGTIVFTAGITKVFDTGAPSNPYPSIAGTHTGTIMPNRTITVNKLYTYPCAGTGGHTEYARIWNKTWNATATWNGYASAFYLLFLGFTDTEKERIEHGAKQKGTGSESPLKMDADTDTHTIQIPETSSAVPEDEAGLLKVLKGNEKRVIEALMEYGEMNQADLSARTGIPKSTLSRILRDLEDRGLVFRYDYGMSKMVKLDSKKSV